MTSYAIHVTLCVKDRVDGVTIRRLSSNIIDCATYADAAAVKAKLETYDTHERSCTICVVLFDVKGKRCYIPVASFEHDYHEHEQQLLAT